MMSAMSFTTPARLRTSPPTLWIRIRPSKLSENAIAALARRIPMEIPPCGGYKTARKGAGPSTSGMRTRLRTRQTGA